jgi:hypothetical protein
LYRRFGLIRATAYTTPVHRALLRSQKNSAILPIWEEPPAQDSAAVEERAADTLEQRLALSNADLPRRARDEAWERFALGDFRLSAKAFSSAAALDRNDLEAHVGAMVCHVALGTLRGAAALLDGCPVRDRRLFELDLDLRERFGKDDLMKDLRTRCKYHAQTEGGDDRTAALHLLLLWYLGERDEAVFIASTIPKRYPGSRYSQWAEQMRAVLSATSG